MPLEIIIDEEIKSGMHSLSMEQHDRTRGEEKRHIMVAHVIFPNSQLNYSTICNFPLASFPSSSLCLPANQFLSPPQILKIFTIPTSRTLFTYTAPDRNCAQNDGQLISEKPGRSYPLRNDRQAVPAQHRRLYLSSSGKVSMIVEQQAAAD